MLLENARLGHPSTRWRRARFFGVATLSTVLGCGHATGTTNNSDDGPCVPGPDGSIGGPPPSDCPHDLPTDTDCAAATPSYQADVAPILRERCIVCHRTGGIEPVHLFDNYDLVYGQREHMLSFVLHCQMPPTCAVGLSPEERAKVLKWFVCKAPNN
jgi:hypothetical protein